MTNVNQETAAVLRACTNKDVKKILRLALKSDLRRKRIKNGLVFYGENGEFVIVHLTVGRGRGASNLAADFRRIGFDVHHPRNSETHRKRNQSDV